MLCHKPTVGARDDVVPVWCFIIYKDDTSKGLAVSDDADDYFWTTLLHLNWIALLFEQGYKEILEILNTFLK